mgnify:CR=1 FL=1
MVDKTISMFNPTRNFFEKRENYEKKITKVLEHGSFINGPEIKELEDKLKEYVNVKHAIGVSSGTDALLVALMAIGVNPDDEVVTIPFTWISTVEVVKILGATPKFCDISADTFNMDPKSLEKVITEKTKVIIPVSMFGHIYDVENVLNVVRIAEKRYGNKIYIVEDAAQSFGSLDNYDRKSCSVSDIGCTSFFPSKPLGCFGDGGMCFTNDDELSLKMRMIKNHGCIERYDYKCIGINGRLDTLQASILLAKYSDFDISLSKRIANAKAYNEAFLNLPFKTPQKHGCNKHVYAQYTVIFQDEKTCNDMLLYLKEHKIGCGKFYPVCLHLVDAITTNYEKGSFPVSEDVSKKVLSLPVYSELLKEERDYIISVIKKYFCKKL